MINKKTDHMLFSKKNKPQKKKKTTTNQIDVHKQKGENSFKRV